MIQSIQKQKLLIFTNYSNDAQWAKTAKYVRTGQKYKNR